MKTPIQLILESEPVGLIVDFGYETPWASGGVEFEDKELFEKLVRITSLINFDFEIEKLDLSDEEEERLWEQKLNEINLSWEDLDLKDDEKWEIKPADGKRTKIYAVRFYEQGFMEWRL